MPGIDLPFVLSVSSSTNTQIRHHKTPNTLSKYITYFTKCSWIGLILLLLLSGCTTRSLSPKETQQLTTKTYPALSPETIIPAVSDLFFLVDDQAYQQTQTQDRLIATRNHGLNIGLTFVEAQDTWTVETQKTRQGTTVSLNVTSQETWITGTTEVERPEGPATYTQFWNRLDFLLGQSTNWMTCNNLTNEYLEDRTWGDTWWLCSGVKDRTPPELIEGTWKTSEGFSLSSEDNKHCAQEVREEKYGIAQTPRQREVYRTLCLENLGYENTNDPSDQPSSETPFPDEPFPDEPFDDRLNPNLPGRPMPHLQQDQEQWPSTPHPQYPTN